MKKLIALILLLTISSFTMFSCFKEDNGDGNGSGDGSSNGDGGGDSGITDENGDGIDGDANIDPDGWTKV